MASRRIIITGGSSALGQAVTRAFLAQGDQVAVIDRGQVAEAPGGPARVGGFDLADARAADAAFAAARARLGGVDALVNLAGGFAFQTVDGPAEVWARMFALNLQTCAHMCRAAAGEIADGGAIVNVGAAAAERAGAGMGAYAASKAGVASLTESLAAELKGRVRVNAVLPLVMDTPQNRADMPHVDPTAWTSTAAVADAIVFLAGPASRAVNGALIPVTAPAAA